MKKSKPMDGVMHLQNSDASPELLSARRSGYFSDGTGRRACGEQCGGTGAVLANRVVNVGNSGLRGGSGCIDIGGRCRAAAAGAMAAVRRAVCRRFGWGAVHP